MRRSPLGPALAALALAACATTPRPAPSGVPAEPAAVPAPPADPALVARVDAIRDEVRRLLERQAEALWRAWTEGAAAELVDATAARDDLFARETVLAVRRVREGTVAPEKRRALLFLETYLAGEHVARASTRETAAVAEVERAVFDADGERIPLAALDARLAVEPDREKRNRIAAAAAPALARLEAARLAEEARIEVAVRDLGYRSYAELGAALRQVELDRIADLARRFLDDTAGLHRRAFGAAARRELGLDPGEVRLADAPRILRGVGYDSGFPRATALPAVEATLSGLGLGFASEGIHVHRGEAEEKESRALCVPVRIPVDVRLSVKPTGGVTDLAALLHEAGHAQHYAHASNGAVELDLLGNQVAGEAFALLFEGLLEDAAWLEEHSDLASAEAAAFRESLATRKLHVLRRHAARLLFEVAWRQGRLGKTAPREGWRRLTEEAAGFPVTRADAVRWAQGDEDFFAVADHLRAFLLAAMIEARLVEQFGARWWQSPAAGTYLRSLWAVGNRDRPLEIARTIGVPDLDPAALVRRFEAALARDPAAPAVPAAAPAAVPPPR